MADAATCRWVYRIDAGDDKDGARRIRTAIIVMVWRFTIREGEGGPAVLLGEPLQLGNLALVHAAEIVEEAAGEVVSRMGGGHRRSLDGLASRHAGFDEARGALGVFSSHQMMQRTLLSPQENERAVRLFSGP